MFKKKKVNIEINIETKAILLKNKVYSSLTNKVKEYINENEDNRRSFHSAHHHITNGIS